MIRNTLGKFARLIALSLAMLVAVPAISGEKLPTFSEVEACIRDQFAQGRSRNEPRNEHILISRSEVAGVLKAIQQLGWDVPDAQQLLDDTLDDQHVLVRTFRTPNGQRFESKIAHQKLMFDRLDRIAGVSGGADLIRDIVKLPNGEKYAKPRSGGGVPDLLDLLPKKASGQTRRIKDYDKPTGHIYTVEQLTKRLAESYQKATPM